MRGYFLSITRSYFPAVTGSIALGRRPWARRRAPPREWYHVPGAPGRCALPVSL